MSSYGPVCGTYVQQFSDACMSVLRSILYVSGSQYVGVKTTCDITLTVVVVIRKLIF